MNIHNFKNNNFLSYFKKKENKTNEIQTKIIQIALKQQQSDNKNTVKFFERINKWKFEIFIAVLFPFCEMKNVMKIEKKMKNKIWKFLN